MRLLYTLLLITVLASCVRAQNWSAARADDPTGDRRIVPRGERVVATDATALHDLLFRADHEETTSAEESTTLLSLPTPDGTTTSFRIVGYHISAAAGLARFPDIRTWYGISTADPTQSVFLDWTARGFHASVRGGDAPDYFIDPVYRGRTDLYQVYRKAHLDPAEETFTCYTEDIAKQGGKPATGFNGKSVGDCNLMEYRLTMTTTGEYSNWHGATSPAQSDLVQSAIVTTVNRVNQIATRNLSLRLVLVGNNDQLYNYDPDNDPFPNNNVGSLIDDNTPYTNGIIGADNYDYGHIVSQGGGGGIASLGASCINSRKAAGATSLGTPEGDFFDVDYLAHEMGHNWGAGHTQNNGCNYSSGSGVEPGSGSTIMSYAGICAPNVQPMVSDYYNGRSMEQMLNHFNGTGNCGAVVEVVLEEADIISPEDHTIPPGTPFKLTSGATGNGTLNYNWEQYDTERGAVMPPVGTNAQGPLFRTLPPVATTERYFPRLPDVIDGTPGQWEALPTVSRTLDFRATVLNYNATYGCPVADVVTLTVEDDNGPFTVADPTATPWLTGQMAPVSWTVAATDAAPFNAARVDVLLSTDGGQTFDVVLADTPNDGFAEVIVPNVTGAQNRIMVRSRNNVFFNVNGSDFTVATGPGTPDVALNNTERAEIVVCFNDLVSPPLSFATISGNGATAPISWSVAGLPGGVNAVFTTSPNAPGDAFTFTLDGLDNLPAGDNTYTLTGTSADGTFTADFIVSKTDADALTAPSSLTPDAEVTDLRPTLNAGTVAGLRYDIEVSVFSDFRELLFAVTGVASPEFLINEYLEGNSTYYWRIRTRRPGTTDICNASAWVEASFTTGDCRIYSSTETALPISSGEPPILVEMDLMVPDVGTINDLDVFELDINHTYVGDLDIDLVHPDGTTVRLWDGDCGQADNIRASFDDEAGADAPCPAADGGFYTAPQALAALDDKPVTGLWTLRVADNANQDGGALNGFALKACLDDAQTLPVTFLSFTATPKKDYILLDWATAEEVNNRGFTIERSHDGRSDWTALGFVAAGTDYTFPDRTALRHTDYFYRLRQEDLDGRVSYSGIRTARLDGGLGLVTYPNPTGGLLHYQLPGSDQPVPYRLIDVSGRVVSEGLLAGATGTLTLTELPAGVYLLRVAEETRRVVKR